MTKPPAKESSAKSAAIWRTSARDGARCRARAAAGRGGLRRINAYAASWITAPARKSAKTQVGEPVRRVTSAAPSAEAT
jgi:hypothetical protein